MKASKVIEVLAIVIALFVIRPFAIMWLWNNLFPVIFGLQEISYWQALGLMIFISCFSLYENHRKDK